MKQYMCFIYCQRNFCIVCAKKHQFFFDLGSVADPDPVGSEPFWVGSGSDQLSGSGSRSGSDQKKVMKQERNVIS